MAAGVPAALHLPPNFALRSRDNTVLQHVCHPIGNYYYLQLAFGLMGNNYVQG